jgi:hypothetical protein
MLSYLTLFSTFLFAMSDDQLTALLAKLNEDAGRREKLQGA